jgi:hypothetical protein
MCSYHLCPHCWSNGACLIIAPTVNSSVNISHSLNRSLQCIDCTQIVPCLLEEVEWDLKHSLIENQLESTCDACGVSKRSKTWRKGTKRQRVWGHSYTLFRHLSGQGSLFSNCNLIRTGWRQSHEVIVHWCFYDWDFFVLLRSSWAT